MWLCRRYYTHHQSAVNRLMENGLCAVRVPFFYCLAAHTPNVGGARGQTICD